MFCLRPACHPGSSPLRLLRRSPCYVTHTAPCHATLYRARRQGADGSYVLEFYKDSKSSESKGAIPLDLVEEVVQVRETPQKRRRQTKITGIVSA